MSTKIRNPWQKVIALTLIFIFVMMITLPAGAQDGVVETTPLTDPPTPDPDQQQVEQGPARNVSHFPEDFESYIPMPLPAHSEVKSELSKSSFVSYDPLTGEETISEVEFILDQLMMEVEGSEDGSAEDELRSPLNFSALSLVTNPENYPYRRSVKMFFRQGGIGYVCSGTLIDPLHVITAGHCVHEGSGGSWSSNVVIAPAYENGSRPFGDAAAAQLHSWTGWTVSGDWDDDIGIIDLNRPVGALTGWHGYGYHNDCGYFTGGTWHHDGYPAESPFNGQYMYTQSGDFDDCETILGIWYGNEVSFNRYSYGGSSGTGAYRDNVVRAVLSNGNSSTTWDVRITDAKYGDIRDTVIADDTPSTFDLIPLDVTISPVTIVAGNQLSSMNFLVHNYSSASRNGTVGLTIYLSTNNIISTSDTSLGSTAFLWDFGPKSSVRVNVSTPPTIPIATAAGNYWIGVILNIADANVNNNDSSGQDAGALAVQAVPVPPAPTNVQASDGTYTDRVRVTWSSVSGATYYEVYRATSVAGSKVKLDSPSATAFDDLSAVVGTTYTYWVKACNTSGCSGYSSYDSGYRAGLPPSTPPANVQASDGDYTDRVQVTWDAAGGATSYEVYRATSAGGAKTQIGTPSSTSFDDVGAVAGTTYTYWVKACNSWGCSGYSSYNTGWRAGTPPANVQASDGTYTDKVLVTWDAATDATSYEVYRATSSGGAKTKIGTPGSNSFDDTGADVGMTYTYWVKACNTPGCSDYSVYDTGWRAGTPPANIQASDGTYTDKVRVIWDAAGYATSYEVYRATSAGGAKTKIGTPSSTSFDDTGIVVGTTYTYWVKACNTWVCSDYSGADDGHAGLAAPQLIYPTDGSVVKDWKPPFEWNASSGAIEYKLQVDDDSDFSSPLIDITTGGTSYTPTSPLADGTYSWRVRASDGAGTWSNYSDVWVVTVDVFKIYLPVILKP